ncbi:MAG: hypothetical protein MJA29_04125 [Candidatus Omnitrophica bacterium]|nr:hypothetical protein [Candidatus Omnitrophota bacterium]
MNATELQQAMASDPVLKEAFGGVYMLHERPAPFRKPQSFIFNTTGYPGKHWVCIYFPERGPARYFDPVGDDIQWSTQCFLEDHVYQWKRNYYRYQGYGTETCGAFCLFYLSMLHYGLDPYQWLDPTNLEKNEKHVKDFVHRAFGVVVD